MISHTAQQESLVDLDAPGAAEAFCQSASHWGFVQIVNHGISQSLFDKVWEQAHLFFGLPCEEKRKVLRNQDNMLGYFDQELTKNLRDLKEIYDFGGISSSSLEKDGHDERIKTGDGYNLWPESLPKFKKTFVEYFANTELLGHRLLGILCEGMGLDSNTLTPFFGENHTGFMRLNYYPVDDPLPSDEVATTAPLGDMALHQHTDAGVLTILLQDDAGGLQAEIDGEWIDVPPLAGALNINVGDLMQIWSNDHYPAIVHRVRAVGERSRYSIPFFLNPSYDTDVAPLPDGPPRYSSVNWGAFRRARSDGDYADIGKEIQIEDFRIC
jgi:isopenicillin N synthase-like dioxygenase